MRLRDIPKSILKGKDRRGMATVKEPPPYILPISRVTREYEIERPAPEEAERAYEEAERLGEAFFVADKEDGSKTLFRARKMDPADPASWSWWCPHEEELTRDKNLWRLYRKIEKYNIAHRKPWPPRAREEVREAEVEHE